MTVTKEGRNKYAETKRIIQEAMNQKQLVLFIGAGASADAGMPLWDQAVCEIADRLGIDKDKDVDSLKIPQYYYNTRGKKEYTQLMRKIFRYKEELTPQPVHDRIIAFNTDTIITTNYDHLIERAAEKNREFIQVISSDVDLPYRQLGKELIKMHGDFEHDNYVLKEDDYLHYQRNFRLIENYIKSLIGTKTILFIGYSLKDPDVKHILSWVHEILAEDIQRAYLIEAGSEFDVYENEYFKNLGVNLIYSKELLEDNGSISTNLLDTLDYLQENEQKDQSLLGIIYDYLRPFYSLNYTLSLYVEKIFNDKRVRKHLSLYDDGYIRVVNNDAEGKKFVQNIKAIIAGEKKKLAQREEIEKLCYIFSHSYVLGVCIDEERILFSKPDDTELEEAIYKFDYKKLQEMKERNLKVLSDKNAEIYLQQATICSFLHDYVMAYTCLSNAIDILYDKKDYARYYIALFSKQNIGKIIQYDIYVEIDKDMSERIKRELEALDLEKTFSTIPNLGNEKNTFLSELQGFRFVSELFYRAYKASNKARKEANQTYILYSGLSGYEELRIKVFDYYLYCLKNNILADRFMENGELYDIYIRSLLQSLSAPDKGVDNSSWHSSSNIHARELTDKDIHIILRYADKNMLIGLLREYDTQILRTTDDAKEYIQDLTATIPEALKNPPKYNMEVFERLLIILARIELCANFVVPIMRSLKGISDSHTFYQMRDALSIFFQALCNQELYGDEVICNEAKNILSILLQFCLDDDDFYLLVKNEIVLLINFCYRAGMPYDNNNVFVRLIEKNNKDFLVVDLYPALSEKTQSFIKELYSRHLNEERFQNVVIYPQMVMAGLREPDADIEDKCFNRLDEINDNRKEGIFEQLSGNPMNRFANLYLAGLVINKERFTKIVSESEDESAKWIVDVENYNYEQFDVKWLRYCKDEYLIELAGNRTVSKKIQDKFYRDYFDGKLEKPEIDIVLKFFLNKNQCDVFSEVDSV